MCVLYSRNTNTSGNIIKDKDGRNTFLLISLILFFKGSTVCLCLRDRGRDIYQRDDFFPYLLPGARGCQRLHSLARSSETTSDRLCVPSSTTILCTLSKNSSRGLLPVTYLFDLSALIVLSYLLITT